MSLTFLITAGPTREYLDPVRFFSNASSGKMGYALARAALRLGHRVVLVSGPVALKPPRRAEYIGVESAREMSARAREAFARADIVIGAAAVADYRPARVSAGKIKRDGRALTLRLVANPDIIRSLALTKGTRAVVGFALETDNLLANARAKLTRKHLDLIIANDAGAIGSDRSSITLIDRSGALTRIENRDKDTLAERIIHEAIRSWRARQADQAVSR